MNFHDPVRHPDESQQQYRERTRRSAAIAKREQRRSSFAAPPSGGSREARRRRETAAGAREGAGMTLAHARETLDAARRGEDVSEALIVRALMRTGDITGLTWGEVRIAERIPVALLVERMAA